MKTQILFLLLLISSSLIAQWEVKHVDSTQFNSLVVVKFLDDETGLAMGGAGIILKTLDGGENWTKSLLPDEWHILDFQFLGGSSLILLASDWTDTRYYRSDDLGESWTLAGAIIIGDGFMTRLAFSANGAGLTGGGEGIFKTSDLGASWAPKWTITGAGYKFGEITEMLFLDDTIAFASVTAYREGAPATFDNFLLKTIDAGETWDSIYTFGNNFEFITSLQFIDQQTGYAALEGGRVFKTEDAGNTWSEISAAAEGCSELFFTPGGLGYASGAFSWFIPPGYPMGLIYKTVDAGATWDTTHTPGIPLWDIYFLNDSTGFTVGNFELILKTSAYGGPIVGDYPWGLFTSTREAQREDWKLRVFPNPFQREFVLSFEETPPGPLQVSILDPAGREVYRTQIQDRKSVVIEPTNLAEGIYFLHIRSEQGEKTVRVVKR